jgi:hypothetical protein
MNAEQSLIEVSNQREVRCLFLPIDVGLIVVIRRSRLRTRAEQLAAGTALSAVNAELETMTSALHQLAEEEEVRRLSLDKDAKQAQVFNDTPPDAGCGDVTLRQDRQATDAAPRLRQPTPPCTLRSAMHNDSSFWSTVAPDVLRSLRHRQLGASSPSVIPATGLDDVVVESKPGASQWPIIVQETINDPTSSGFSISSNRGSVVLPNDSGAPLHLVDPQCPI